MDTLMNILVSWFPMILLIVVWLYFMKRGGLGKQQAYMEQLLDEQKTLNKHMERMAKSLEDIAKKR